MSDRFLQMSGCDDADRGVSLSVLGWVPGIITMVLCGLLFWVTSITMHKYIMKHPHIMDICASSTVRDSWFLRAMKANRLLTERRLWISCIWTEQNCLHLLRIHDACEQYSSHRISRLDRRQGSEYPLGPLIVHGCLLNHCGPDGSHHVYPTDLAPC